MAFRPAAILLAVALVVVSQVPFSSATTEEARLRAALSDPKTTSFELKSTIKLTKNLPPLALASGKVRSFRIFSKGAYSISGAKKYRGFWTPEIPAGVEYPIAKLTIENVKLLNFRVKYTRKTSNDFGSVGFNGAAIGVEKTDVKILYSSISGSRAWGTGGAIYLSEGSLDIYRTGFLNNVASIGGALDIAAYGKPLTILDSYFTGNKANGQTPFGGAINIQLSALISITRTTFNLNSAGSGAAFRAIFNDDEQPTTPITFDSTTFDSNTASDAVEGGGAVEVNGVAEIRFLRSSFTNNKAGGAPNNVYVIQRNGGKTKIRVVAGTLTNIKGNNPNNFVVV